MSLVDERLPILATFDFLLHFCQLWNNFLVLREVFRRLLGHRHRNPKRSSRDRRLNLSKDDDVNMALSLLLFVAGLALVIYFAEKLVKGAVGTLAGLGISTFVIFIKVFEPGTISADRHHTPTSSCTNLAGQTSVSRSKISIGGQFPRL
jgi:hypothetical protein